MYVVCLKLVQSMVVRVPFGNCETRCVVRKPSVKATRMVCFGTLVEVTPMIRQNVVCTFIATQVCVTVELALVSHNDKQAACTDTETEKRKTPTVDRRGPGEAHPRRAMKSIELSAAPRRFTIE